MSESENKINKKSKGHHKRIVGFVYTVCDEKLIIVLKRKAKLV